MEMPGFAQLPSSAETALQNALASLRTLLAGNCTVCDTYVFNKNVNGDRKAFLNFLNKPSFYDGTRSTVQMNVAMCDQTWLSKLVGTCDFNAEPAYVYAKNDDDSYKTAFTRTRNARNKPLLTFVDPAQVSSSVQENEALIFHEALHPFSGLFDYSIFTGARTLESVLGTATCAKSIVITNYLLTNIFGITRPYTTCP